MKKNFILMLALSLLVFTSCSKDDDEEGNPKGKQVSKFTSFETGSSGDNFTILFEYDEKGRITKTTYHEIDNNEAIFSVDRYIYGNDVITLQSTWKGQDTDIRTYHLKDGLITHSTGDVKEHRAVYTYNSKNEMTKCETGHVGTYIYTWENGNIISNGDGRTYTYSTIEDKTQIYLHQTIPRVNEELYSQGYFGVRNKNLIASEEDEYSKSEYEYELNDDGYVIEERRYDDYSGTKELDETNTFEYK